MSWPINEKAEEMYEMYNRGRSLEEVALSYGCTRQSVYGLFMYRGWKTRPKRRPLEFVLFNGQKYTIRNTGYYGKTKEERTLLHRDVWEHHNGKIDEGLDIHHIDNDKRNNRIENLECLSKAEHTRKYSPHHNQYTKERKKG